MNIIPFQNRLSAEVVAKVIDHIDIKRPAGHSLTKKEISDAAGHALWHLQQNRPSNEYLPRKKTALACGILVDYEKKRTTLILRKRGKNYRRFADDKKTCMAIELAFTGDGIRISPVRCYIDKDPTSLQYAMKYGSVSSVVKVEKRLFYTSSATNIGEVPVLEMIRQVGGAVARMHQDGVTHGNISPKNIVFSKESGFHLTNFLLARNSGSQNVVYGTVNYTAPEQLSKNCAEQSVEENKAADWYALGCAIYELSFKHNMPWNSQSGRKSTILRNQKTLSAHFATQKAKHAMGAHRLVYSLFEGLLNADPEARMNGPKFHNLIAAFINHPESSITIEGKKMLLRPDSRVEPLVEEETSSARQSPQLLGAHDI